MIFTSAPENAAEDYMLFSMPHEQHPHAECKFIQVHTVNNLLQDNYRKSV